MTEELKKHIGTKEIEEAYSLCGNGLTFDKEDWLSIAKDELAGLQEKIAKLSLFINTEKYQALSVSSKRLINSQLSVIHTYASALDMRIPSGESSKVPDPENSGIGRTQCINASESWGGPRSESCTITNCTE